MVSWILDLIYYALQLININYLFQNGHHLAYWSRWQSRNEDQPRSPWLAKYFSNLGTIKDPIAILSVVGKYRTGKSYFINKVLLKEQAFQVGNTVNACTRGIWMYKKTIRLEEKKA